MAFTIDAQANGNASGISLTVASTAKLVIATGVTRKASAPAGITGVQFGGQNMTALTKQTNSSVTAQIWYLIDPPTGTQSLTWSASDANPHAAVASFTVGAGKTSAFDTEAGTTGSSTTPSQAITPGAQPNVIITTASHEGANASTGAGTGQIGLYGTVGTPVLHTDEGVWNSSASREATTSTSSDTQSFTNGASDLWAIAVATFKEADVPVVINVDTAGQITWTGSSGITASTSLNTGWDETGRFWTEVVSSTGQYPAGGDAVSEIGVHLFSLVTAGTTTVNVDTAGAVTWTGQALGLRTSITPTAGAITWAGQTVGLKTTVTPTSGALTWAGATDITLVTSGNIVVDVTTPGQISWTGQTVDLITSIPMSSGVLTWAGQPLGLKITLGVSAGQITWTGANDITLQAGGNVVVQVTVPGSVTWTGQTVVLRTSIAVGAGQLRWTGGGYVDGYGDNYGEAVGLTNIITPTAGAITWAGQTVGLKRSVIPTAGAVTWAGQSVGLKTTVVVTPGQVTWQGQTIAFGGTTLLAVTVPGAVTWSGQTVNLVRGIVPVPGAVTWSGQTLGLTTKVGVAAGQITWAGQTVFAFAGVLGEPVDPALALDLAAVGAVTGDVSEGRATFVVTEGHAT